MKPNFEESQFADYFRDELRMKADPQDGYRFAPMGQVLEAKLGWDSAAMLPAAHPTWADLGSTGLPGTVRSEWNPDLDLNAAVTEKALNVFFQFKRSDHLVRSNATYWNHFGRDYWQFFIDRSENPGSLPQHDLLTELEGRTAGRALVRYVAPLCHEFRDLERLSDGQQLTANCIYVSPAEFDPDHERCVFIGTGPGECLVNPDPTDAAVDSWTSATETLQSLEGAVGDELIAETASTLIDLDESAARELRGRWATPESTAGDDRELVNQYLIASRWLYQSGVAWFAAYRNGPSGTATSEDEQG